MPRISLTTGLDVFAFVDADTDEAKGFTTYLGYWDGTARYITDLYGDDPGPALVVATRALSAVRKLTAKPFAGDPEQLQKILLNGWAQELGLYAVDDDDPRLMLQNLWNNVQAYYATSAAVRAFLYVRSGEVPARSHARTLRQAAGIVVDTRLLPTPWNVCCSAERPPTYKGFAADPGECHNLELGADAAAVVAKALKTTRRRELVRQIDQYKTEHKLARAPHGLRSRIDGRMAGTTLFDFLWRNRTRSNYGDPSMFYVGALSQARSTDYVRSVRLVTTATMLVFETLIAQRAPKLLEDTAVHFISRDRSQISDQVLGGRLRTLGLLAPPVVDFSDEPF